VAFSAGGDGDGNPLELMFDGGPLYLRNGARIIEKTWPADN
jgi:hypothetical protein